MPWIGEVLATEICVDPSFQSERWDQALDRAIERLEATAVLGIPDESQLTDLEACTMLKLLQFYVHKHALEIDATYRPVQL